MPHGPGDFCTLYLTTAVAAMSTMTHMASGFGERARTHAGHVFS